MSVVALAHWVQSYVCVGVCLYVHVYMDGA